MSRWKCDIRKTNNTPAFFFFTNSIVLYEGYLSKWTDPPFFLNNIDLYRPTETIYTFIYGIIHRNTFNKMQNVPRRPLVSTVLRPFNVTHLRTQTTLFKQHPPVFFGGPYITSLYINPIWFFLSKMYFSIYLPVLNQTFNSI